MAILTIDLGTSAVKILIFDTAGKVLAQARAGYPTHRPQPGWAEQDPIDWWKAIVQATASLRPFLDQMRANVDAIGLTGQMHGPVLLGNNGKTLGPCFIWMDSRAQKESDALNEVFGLDQILNITGNFCVPAFPAAKLGWFRSHAPALFKQVRWVLMPKDYIGYLLTKEIATDPSDASGTLLYDPKAGCWSDELLEWVSLPSNVLPPVIGSAEILGTLTASAAQELQMSPGVPVIKGAGDLATSALGLGVVAAGRAGVVLGTAGQLLLHSDRWPERLLGNIYVFSHAISRAYLALGTVPAGGASLFWVTKLLGGDVSSFEESFARLLCLAEEAAPGAKGLTFLPYLAGTGTPYMDYQARGAFFGLTESHGPGDLVRAVMEGVAYALRDSLDFILSQGFVVEDLSVAGGALKEKLWVQILAEVFRRPLRISHTLDVSSLGAFVLSAVAVGFYADPVQACEAVVKTSDPFIPTSLAGLYESHYQRFRSLYQALRRVQ
ncbi:MAG: xylulokinase [Thermofilaceae archaeon]